MPHYTDGNKLYNDQKFYEEFCNNIKENIYKTNSSLIYEVGIFNSLDKFIWMKNFRFFFKQILNKADVYYPEDEAELIKRLVEGKIKNEPLSEGESGTETVSPENQIILSESDLTLLVEQISIITIKLIFSLITRATITPSCTL